LRAGTEAATALEGRARWTRDFPNYVLKLAPSWEEFRKGLKRNIRESLRHCYNSLTKDGHAFTLEVARTPDEVEKAIGPFLALHQRRAELEGTVKHGNVFGSGTASRFLVDVCRRLAARGSTRVFSLVISGKVVAVRIGFVLQDSIYMYYSGYDPDWRK